MAERDFVMRPLSLTEIIDESFGLYRNNFGLLFGIALIPNVLAGLLVGIFTVMATSGTALTIEAALAGFMVMMVGILIASMGTEVGNGAMTSAISERILGRNASIGSSYGRIGRRIIPFIGFVILRGLLITFGMMLCFWPGIIFTVMTFVAVCAFVLEGQGPRDSLERSWKLTTGNGWRVFGLAILTMLLAVIISFAIEMVFSVAVTGSLGAAASATVGGEVISESPIVMALHGTINGLASGLVAPLIAGVVTILYYDLRVRKEGFDLEMLAETLNRG